MIRLQYAQCQAAFRGVCAADVDGDGLPELVIETDDGYVRILKSIEDSHNV